MAHQFIHSGYEFIEKLAKALGLEHVYIESLVIEAKCSDVVRVYVKAQWQEQHSQALFDILDGYTQVTRQCEVVPVADISCDDRGVLTIEELKRTK